MKEKKIALICIGILLILIVLGCEKSIDVPKKTSSQDSIDSFGDDVAQADDTSWNTSELDDIDSNLDVGDL